MGKIHFPTKKWDESEIFFDGSWCYYSPPIDVEKKPQKNLIKPYKHLGMYALTSLLTSATAYSGFLTIHHLLNRSIGKAVHLPLATAFLFALTLTSIYELKKTVDHTIKQKV
jgi:hypothetical protein